MSDWQYKRPGRVTAEPVADVSEEQAAALLSASRERGELLVANGTDDRPTVSDVRMLRGRRVLSAVRFGNTGFRLEFDDGSWLAVCEGNDAFEWRFESSLEQPTAEAVRQRLLWHGDQPDEDPNP